MKFKTSAASNEFIESFYQRVGARNKAVLGRAGLFLALGAGIPAEFRPADAKGVDLDDETVLGEELRDIVRIALHYRAGRTLDEDGYRQEFRRYFEYGCGRLALTWEDCGRDQARFVSELLRLCGTLPDGSSSSGQRNNRALDTNSAPIVPHEVRLRLLTEVDDWTVNRGGQNSLLVISGQPGLGKSQLALDLLAQIARQGVRFLFFDLKGELEEAGTEDPQKAANRQRFFDLTGAQYIRLIDNSLPVNPLYAGRTAPETANIASRVASLVRAFGPQMGANQEDAIRQAYAQLSAPDFTSLAAQLGIMGQTGVALAVLNKIVDLNIFANAVDARPFEEWIRRSVVIDLKRLDNDTRVLVVAFILNFFIERLNQNLSVRNGIQPLQMVLFVDEAHNILPKDSKAKLLEKLAREGRSWGFPLWLASQDADKLMSTGVNFTELATAGIHFSPQTLSSKEQKQILGGTILKPLEKGQAALRLNGKLTIGVTRQFWKDGGS